MNEQAQSKVRDAGETRRDWRAVLDKVGPLIGLAFVWGLFAILRPDTFITWENNKIMLLQTTVVGVAALGATFIIISGGIDLSVGSVIALSGVVTALALKARVPGCAPDGSTEAVYLATQMPVLWPLAAALAGIAVAALCGTAIGLMVIGHIGRVSALVIGGLAGLWGRRFGLVPSILVGIATSAVLLAGNEFGLKKVRLVPFIVTLGMLGILRGAAEGLAEQQMVRAPNTWLNSLLAMGTGKSFLAQPPGVFLMLALAFLTAGTLRYTRFGRHIFAIGSNEQTARLCGVAVERTKLIIYAVGVTFAGVAGLLQFSYLRMGDPTTAPGHELNVIASVVIGGGSLSGGQGSILGTLIGALIMTVVGNGCNKMGLDPWVQKIVTGAIIVVAVALDQVRQRRE